MSMQVIRGWYNVPAKRGARIRYTGEKSPQLGTIVASKGSYIRIRMDGEKRAESYHPTWEIEYLDNPITKADATF
jgi:hypothetical protein